MKRIYIAAGMLVCAGWFVGCAADDPAPGDTRSVAAADSAAVPDAVGPCLNGDVCLYQNGQQTGAHIEVTAGISIHDLGTVTCPACTNGTGGSNGTFDKQMSSWQNASDMEYCWIGLGGATHGMKPHTQNTVPAEYNDHASALLAGVCP